MTHFSGAKESSSSKHSLIFHITCPKTRMEILEVDHAVLCPYEVLRLIKRRQKEARKYDDARDQELLKDYQRVRDAREMMIPALMAMSPEGTDEDGNDSIQEAITQFCRDLQELCPTLTSFQIRNVLAVRPRNHSELACLFPTPEEWGSISGDSEALIQLVNHHFPLSAFDR
jgi:hypothetical protein